METDKNREGERIRLTNIVGETKKIIMEESNDKKRADSQLVTDDDVKIAIERINPDPNSLKYRG